MPALSIRFEPRTRHNINTIVTATVFTTVAGILYLVVKAGFHPHAIPVGGISGFLIGIISVVAELFFFGPVGRRWKFSVLLTARTFFYLLIVAGTIILVSIAHNSAMFGTTWSETFNDTRFQEYLFGGDYFKDVLFALIVILAVNFIRQINHLLGRHVLLYYVIGKYHHPVEEQRVFMFLDLNSSTTIAEKLGHERYHLFLNEFFFDITPAIVESKGEIYQYVGDEVVITWSKESGLTNANCLRCYFRIAAAIQLLTAKYEERYGVVPTFKAGYHFGSVITGIIGDVRKEIVFHGDTVNTAARIRSECAKVKRGLLLSGDLLSRLTAEEFFTPEPIGNMRLRGKEEEVQLYSILEAA